MKREPRENERSRNRHGSIISEIDRQKVEYSLLLHEQQLGRVSHEEFLVFRLDAADRDEYPVSCADLPMGR